MKKQLICVVLAFGLIFSACGKNSSSSSPSSSSANTSSSASSASDSSSSAEQQTVLGTVTAITGDQFTLLAANGKSYVFLLDSTTVEGSKTLALQDTVEVTYEGPLVEAAKAVYIKITASESQSQVPETPGQIKGTIEDAAMSSFTIRTANDKLYSFRRVNTQIIGKNALTYGTSVTVYYSGSLADFPEATKLVAN